MQLLDNLDLTVIIPTKNRSIFLNRLLESLSNQKINSKIKCVISDNNSTDSTKEIVNKWKKNDKLEIFFIENKESISLLENWKILVDSVNTKYSKFIFDDDWLEDNCLGEMLSILNNYEIEVVISNFNVIEEDDKHNYSKVRKSYIKSDSRYLTKDDILNFYLLKGPVQNVSPSGSMFKTEILKEAFNLGLKNKNICTEKGIGIDLIMNFYPLFATGKQIFFTSDSLVNYSAHDDSITVKTDVKETYYCYLDSLIFLIDNFKTSLTSKQSFALKKKILVKKTRKIINSNKTNISYD